MPASFIAFNNCIYCNSYTDDCYETSWHPWLVQSPTDPQKDNLNLMFKEGRYYTGARGNDASGGTYKGYLYRFPEYYWKRQYISNAYSEAWGQGKTGGAAVFDVVGGGNDDPIPAGIVWDPYERPDHVGELRAGKNAITYHWEPAACDTNKSFNLDRIMDYTTWTTAGPYTGTHRIGTGIKYTDMDPEIPTTYGQWAIRNTTFNPGAPEASTGYEREDYTIPNWCNLPIVPNAWVWHELKNSIADYSIDKAWKKIDKYWCGTESEQYKYPPYQMFIKGIPIFDSNAALIPTDVQLSVKVTLSLLCKKRRTAYYCVPFGPLSGQQLYYHNPQKLIFQENYIRYRTGGQRRTWQNMMRNSQTGSSKLHSRLDCYSEPSGPDDIVGQTYTSSTFPNPLVSQQGGLSVDPEDNNRSIQITTSGGKTTVRYIPKPKAREKTPSPEKYADVQMMEQMSSL